MPSISKRVLGRGLSDLIPIGGDEENSALAATASPRALPVGALHRNPNQPRTIFDEAALSELAESIKLNGVLQPILVRPRAAGGYEIVAGERRFRAGLKAGLKELPVVIRELTDAETLALALIENLVREDIGPLEAARAFQRLMDQFGWTQEEMGSRVGKSRSAVANSLRLLTLPENIQQSVERGELSEGHARALIGDERQRQTPDFAKRQASAWKRTISDDLSVRDLEKLMRDGRGENMPPVPTPASENKNADISVQAERRNGFSAPKSAIPADFRALEDRFRSALGTRIRLNGTADRGRIEIEFFSAEELDGLLTRFESGAKQ